MYATCVLQQFSIEQLMQNVGFPRRRQIFNQPQSMSGHFAQVGTNFLANLIKLV